MDAGKEKGICADIMTGELYANNADDVDGKKKMTSVVNKLSMILKDKHVLVKRIGIALIILIAIVIVLVRSRRGADEGSRVEIDIDAQEDMAIEMESMDGAIVTENASDQLNGKSEAASGDGSGIKDQLSNSQNGNDGITGRFVVALPFTTFQDAQNFTLNKTPTKWWQETLLFADIYIVVLNGSADYQEERAKFIFPYVETKIVNRINIVGDNIVDDREEEMMVQVIKDPDEDEDGENRIDLSLATDIDDDESQTDRYLGEPTMVKKLVKAPNPYTIPFQIISMLTWANLVQNGAYRTKQNKPIKLSFAAMAIIPEGVYVDPTDLKQVLTKYSESLSSDRIDASSAITVENSMVIVSKQFVMMDMFKTLRKPLTKSTSAMSPEWKKYKCLINDNLETCLNKMEIKHNSFNKIARSRRLIVDRNVRSCSLPHENFGFQEIKLDSFRRCSFVSGITKIYEYHAIRYLQRLGRKLPIEVDWKQDQNQYKERHCDIAIGLTSVPDKLYEREVVRETWGQLARSLGTVRVFFVYGTTEKQPDRETREELEAERKEFNDIVLLPIIEGYFRMFTKVTTWLGWGEANTNCATVMKVDPDTYLRVFPLIKFMYARRILPHSASMLPSGDKLAGAYFGLIGHTGTNMERNHKWYFYDVWPHDFTPPFMTGAGMGMSRQLAKYVYERRLPDRRLDDPGIGLILHGLSVGTKRLRLETGREWTDGIKRANLCTNDKILENPFFLQDFDMRDIYRKDIYDGTFCENTGRGYPGPRKYLQSDDNKKDRVESHQEGIGHFSWTSTH